MVLPQRTRSPQASGKGEGGRAPVRGRGGAAFRKGDERLVQDEFKLHPSTGDTIISPLPTHPAPVVAVLGWETRRPDSSPGPAQ